MFIFKTKHVQELLGSEHTVANIVDDLTVFDVYKGYAYVAINSGLNYIKVFSFEVSDDQYRLLDRFFPKESYTFYDVKCPYCKGELIDNKYLFSPHCTDCGYRAQCFEDIQELLKSGKIIKMRPRWRWVK